MTQTIIAPHNRTLRIYGCGGGGINVTRARMTSRSLYKDNRAEEQYTLIDTSLSNLEGADKEDTYTLKGVDGSGGNPATNAAKIKAQLPDMLDANPPADTNIIVFSNGGGTGSAAAPILARHLLEAGHTVIIVMIGMSGEEALRTVRNALITVKNLELAVEMSGRPLATVYAPLNPNESMQVNNALPLFALDSISVLVSGKNHRIDKADIDNFLDYQNVTNQTPALSLLNINLEKEKLMARNKVTSYLALMQDDDTPAPRIQSDYAKHGLLSSGSSFNHPLFYTLTANLGDVYDDLKEMEKVATNRKSARVETTRLSSGKETVNDDSGLLYD